jgi:CDP-ribitol ribitolphosphotransferase
MGLLLFIAKCGLRFLYLLFWPLKAQNKVVMLSRESYTVPLDFRLLEKELHRRSPQTEVVYFCRKMTKHINVFSYCWFLVRSLYHIATASVAVTDTYSIQLCVLPPKKGLTVVQIWHAVGAVKKFSYQCLDTANGHSSAIARQMCMHKNYDYILCTSEATRSVYVEAFHTPREKILVLGMPRVDYIQRTAPGLRRRFLKERPDLRGKKLLLYLPTFREGVDEGTERLLHAAAGRYDIALLVKPHPLSTFHVPRGNQPGAGWSTYDLMKVCDGIITDYSASSLEASLLHKPVYFYLFDYESYKYNQGLNIDPSLEMPSAVSVEAGPLMDKIQTGRYDLSALERFRSKYIQTADENNTAAIVRFLLDHIPVHLRQQTASPAGKQKAGAGK